MEEKKKRVVTRIGDIFCVENKEYKAYFQYIAIDFEYLNSSTVRVFKKRYSLDYEFNAEEVVQGEVEFYAHTMLQPGLKGGFWTKVGKSKDIGDIENVLFRTTDWTPVRMKSYRWYIGGINKKYVFIGELTEEYAAKTYEATLVPPIDIVMRIETGKWRGFEPY